ncbi:hypothetical protein N9R54_01315 [Pelobium sp.]|nr:hypothetical protein [Pelobium sp.]
MVQDLFLQSNYNVFNYGMERVMPGFAKYLSPGGRSKVNKALRFMSDFVVQSMETGDLFYLEVKFRANGKYSIKELPADYPYKNAWFVIVSPQKIQCVHYKRLAEGFAISPQTHYHLTGIKSFHIVPELIQEYETYAKTLFSGFQ